MICNDTYTCCAYCRWYQNRFALIGERWRRQVHQRVNLKDVLIAIIYKFAPHSVVAALDMYTGCRLRSAYELHTWKRGDRKIHKPLRYHHWAEKNKVFHILVRRIHPRRKATNLKNQLSILPDEDRSWINYNPPQRIETILSRLFRPISSFHQSR